MSEEGVPLRPQKEFLSDDEILRIVKILSREGVEKVRLTGGEPLLRPHVTELIRSIKKTPRITSVHMTTNGAFLKSHLTGLVEAGLDGINISLDTLQDDRFESITRRKGLETVLDSIRTAADSPTLKVKVNVVLMRGINGDEIPQFLQLAESLPVTVRFIELMPFDDHQIWKTGRYMGTDMILEEIRRVIPELIRERGTKTEQFYFKPKGFTGAFAVIPSFSRTICRQCNRIRLTADGKIRNCLYSNHEFDLLSLLRNGGSDEEILRFVRNAMAEKEEDGFIAEERNRQTRTSMTQIGG